MILAPDGAMAGRAQPGHGFRVIARVVIWRKDGVLTIPVGALFRDGQGWATCVIRDGRGVLQRFELVDCNEESAQVLGGVQAGIARSCARLTGSSMGSG